MKIQKIIFIIFICLIPSLIFSQTPVSGNVSGTWTKAGSPYYVTDNCQVTDTLTIEPGVVVKFGGFFEIKVTGVFNAIGAETEPIIFTSAKSSPASDDWNRLYFMDCVINIKWLEIYYANVGLELHAQRRTFSPKVEHINIENSQTGMYLWDQWSANFEGEILHCSFVNCQIGIYCSSYDNGWNKGYFHHNIIKNCDKGFLFKYGNNGQKIENNTICYCSEYGIFCDVNVEGEFKNNIFLKNNIGISRSGSLPTVVNYNCFYNDSTNFEGFPDSYGKNWILNANGDSCDLAYNIMLDPMIVDSLDFRLKFGSPCIDAGDPDTDDDGTSWESDPDDQDQDGTILDMGAYFFNQNTVPVELGSFQVSVTGNTVKLKWTTETETNNFGFEIERSIDSNWEKIVFVKGNGSTAKSNSYEFEDDLSVLDFDVSFLNYRLKQIDTDGSFEYSQILTIELNHPVSYQLEQNYPNPFNPTTTIKFSVPQGSFVEIKIYSILGQKIRTLISEKMTAGRHKIIWEGKNDNGASVTSGIYIYKIAADDFVDFHKMILAR